MANVVVVKPWDVHAREERQKAIFFLTAVGLVILAAFLTFIFWTLSKSEIMFYALVLITIILFLFRKKIFSGNHKAREMKFADSMKAFIVYWISYSIAFYILYKFVLPRIDNIWIAYLAVGVTLTVFGKIGGFVHNRKWVLNKQIAIWIIVYAWIAYMLVGFNQIFFKMPITPLLYIIYGFGTALLSRFAWNAMYRRY